MFVDRKKLEKEDIGGGLVMQYLGCGNHMNVLHWDIADGGVVELHHHESEQFGYIIKGGFDMNVGDDRKTLREGDCYFIPSNVPHRFVAVGETEAIDIFSPFKPDPPGKPKKIQPFEWP
jgi:quercetin dioxygenase-like cupin family protein